MGDFNRDRGSSGGRNFGRRDFGGKSGDRQMFKTICSKCNKECEVPFVPTGSRPVFCKDCFQNNRASDPNRSENNYSRRSDFEDRGNNQIIRPVGQSQHKEQFEVLNVKLDKILKILEPKVIAVIAPAEIIKAPKAKKAAKKSTSTKKKE
ncbi:MAG: hypothetical protein HW400_504 [Candidatus Levybacteria bacterium]|nr:hypothetical protein [Candidatus Levybacteria bacterium]